ncbi:MAG: glycine cleavage system protein GcvH [Planctomycetota bacterium]
MKPEDLLFAETHEWAHVTQGENGKVATVGLSAFALEQLTDLVYLELPEVGKTVRAGDEFGEVESVKAVSSLFSPVDGTVIEVNTSLPDHLETLGEDPYESGWIARIEMSDESSLDKLMDYDAYQKQCAEEG